MRISEQIYLCENKTNNEIINYIKENPEEAISLVDMIFSKKKDDALEYIMKNFEFSDEEKDNFCFYIASEISGGNLNLYDTLWYRKNQE